MTWPLYVNTGTEPLPKLVIEYAPTSAPKDEPAGWHGVTDYFIEGSVQRGRQRETDEMQAGSGGLLLENFERAWDPTHTSGPYYPLTLLNQWRIGLVHEGAVHYVFRGFGNAYRLTWNSATWGTTRVRLIDAMGLLASERLSTVETQEGAGTRIGNLLDDVLWPASLRSGLSGGGLCLQHTYGSQDMCWPSIQEAVRTGGANTPAWVDGQGRVRYGGVTASGYTFGDDAAATELSYEGADLDYSIDAVFGTVKVKPFGGIEQITGSGLGGAVHARDTLSITDAAAASLAASIASTYGTPTARPEGVTVRPLAESTVWNAVLDLDLQDTFTLKRRPPGGGATYSKTVTVLGLEHKFSSTLSDWETTYRLSGSTV